MVGAEAARTGPTVIVSDNGANITAARLGRGVLSMVPVTFDTAAVHPIQVPLAAAKTRFAWDSKAQGEQTKQISDERIGRMIGSVPLDLMAESMTP